MSKKVAVLIADFVEEVEFIYPYYRLLEEGYEVKVLSPDGKGVKGKKGLPILVDGRVGDYTPEDFDAVFVPGGYAPDRLRRYREVLDFVRGIYDAGKPVSSICHGPWVLISAGIVKGKRITGYFAIKDDIVNAGAHYTGNPVEVDGNIITGTDPSAMPSLMKAFIQAIERK